jgi:RNA polymerase sigma-70 factor (ECF subfamily)
VLQPIAVENLGIAANACLLARAALDAAPVVRHKRPDVPPSDDLARVARALEGDAASVRALVASFTPVLQARAARALIRRGGGQGRDPRQELADLVQEVFLVLFRDDGRVLRSWQPERGLSLLNFVGLVAEREVRQIAISGRRSPWALDPSEESEIERAAPLVEGPESAFASRHLFGQMVERLESELNAKAFELFRLLVVEDLPAPEVCAMTGLSSDAVYTWRSRLLRRARQLLTELAPDSSRSAPSASASADGSAT